MSIEPRKLALASCDRSSFLLKELVPIATCKIDNQTLEQE
jgi:hypothetical protein